MEDQKPVASEAMSSVVPVEQQGPEDLPTAEPVVKQEDQEDNSGEAEEVIKEPVRIPGPPPLADLLDLGIDEEIQKEDKERLKGKARRFPLSPSQFGACGRLLAMGLAEYASLGIFPLELMDARAKKRFSRGYDIEYSLMKQLKKYIPIDQGFGQQYLTMDLTQDGKYVIGGSLDTCFITEESMVVDIKSKADYWSAAHTGAFEETFINIGNMPGVTTFGERSYFIEDIDAFYEQYPKDDFIGRYFVQLNAYGASEWARNFRSNLFPGHVGIKAVALFFENKNNHTNAEIRWVPSQKMYDDAVAKMKDIYQWVVLDKKDPAKYKADFTLGSVNCRLCPRKAACWGDTRHPYNGPKKKWPTDSNRVGNSELLEATYLAYKKALTGKSQHDNLESDLIREMVASGEQKLRFPDGLVFEIKELKTPKPHFVLRPSK